MHKSSPIKIWRKFSSRYRLLGNICTKCQHKYYPPVKLCKECCNDLNEMSELVPYEFSPYGKLITWSQVSAAPKGYEEFTPYIIGIIELEDGERITSQIVDINESDLKHGLPLEAVFRKIYTEGEAGIIHYGLKFKSI